MITQQTVRQELETLKRYIDSGGVRIPSLWSSMRMGVSIVAWMIFCSVIMSFFITQKTSETLMSVLFCSVWWLDWFYYYACCSKNAYVISITT